MEGMRQVWNAISVILSALPTEIIMVATLAFMGAVIISLMRWLR